MQEYTYILLIIHAFVAGSGVCLAYNTFKLIKQIVDFRGKCRKSDYWSLFGTILLVISSILVFFLYDFVAQYPSGFAALSIGLFLVLYYIHIRTRENTKKFFIYHPDQKR